MKLRAALRDELLAMRALHSQAPAEGFVFSTLTGGRPSPDNLRSRVLRIAVERANENLAKQGLSPLPERSTPHSLRRTFASVLYALGEDPGVVMDEMGHTDPALALRVYRQSMRRVRARSRPCGRSSRVLKTTFRCAPPWRSLPDLRPIARLPEGPGCRHTVRAPCSGFDAVAIAFA